MPYNVRMNEPLATQPLPTSTKIRPDILSDAFLGTLRQHGVIQAHLFGSVARGQERPDSDIDLLVKFDRTVSLLDIYGLSNELELLSGRRVDVMTALDAEFAPFITPTLVPVTL